MENIKSEFNNYPETPCYIMHREELWQGIALLKTALEENWGNSIVGYSFKTNALPWALMQMKAAGFYAEVVSEDEYELARYLGFEQVIYNGPVKSKTSFLHALEKGAVVNLDAKRELDWLRASGLRDGIRVGLRVNFDLEAVCPGETSSGREGGRFGFSYETGEFLAALEALADMGVKLSGVHLHASSRTRSVGIYRALARMACKLKREYGLALSYVDIGGGYFGGMENKPKFPEYMRAIREELLDAFTPEETTLIVEPGTSLITPPVEYITTVVDCKDTCGGRFVVTDGSRIDVDPLHGKSSYFYKIQYGVPGQDEDRGGAGQGHLDRGGAASREKVGRQVVCGFTCMENDRLFVLEDAPLLQPGDRIVYQKVGGYTMCLTPLFIRYFPAVYVEDGDSFLCVRERWRAEDYIRKSHYEN